LYISDDGQIEPEHNSATDCKYCTTGKEFVSAITVCQICGAGKYQSTNNLANASCIACIGRYILDDRQIDTEHDSQDDCTFCSTGKEFVSTTEVCQICAAGKFQSANDAVGPSCETCVGLYILDDRQIDTEHDSQEDCKYCTTGKEFVSAITVCRICGAGKFQGANNELSPSCKDCDVGLYIEDDSTIDSEHASCKFCPLGREYVDLVSVYPYVPFVWLENTKAAAKQFQYRVLIVRRANILSMLQLMLQIMPLFKIVPIAEK
jgi:hypothetical protein